jgi:hypothetical protein
MLTVTTTSSNLTPGNTPADARIRTRFAGRVRTAITKATSRGTLGLF